MIMNLVIYFPFSEKKDDPLPIIIPREEKLTETTTTTTTTTTTQMTTTEEEEIFAKVKCGGNGFYQVGNSCYTFTFYRSISYNEATKFCNVNNLIPKYLTYPVPYKVSGGYLAILDSEEERQWVRNHLTKHVASNICWLKVLKSMNNLKLLDPWETVTFFVGGFVDQVTIMQMGWKNSVYP